MEGSGPKKPPYKGDMNAPPTVLSSLQGEQFFFFRLVNNSINISHGLFAR